MHIYRYTLKRDSPDVICRPLLPAPLCPPSSEQGPRLEQSTFRLAVGVLLHLTASEDGCLLLIKSAFLPACHKALHDMSSLSAGPGLPRPAAKPLASKDLQRQAALMQVGGTCVGTYSVPGQARRLYLGRHAWAGTRG